MFCPASLGNLKFGTLHWQPVDSKQGGKKSRDKDTLLVEISNQPENALPVVTSNASIPMNIQEKSCRTIRCKICIDSFGSIRELDEHHLKDHGIVDCDACDKKFEMQTALGKHMYMHIDLRFVCETCRQSFPFKSRLEQHWITHQVEANYMCK